MQIRLSREPFTSRFACRFQPCSCFFFCAALNQKFNASGSFCYFRLFSTIVCGLHGEKFCRQMMRASLKIQSEVLEINAISCSIKQFLCSSTQIQFSITKVFFLLQENCSAMTKKTIFMNPQAEADRRKFIHEKKTEMLFYQQQCTLESSWIFIILL